MPIKPNQEIFVFDLGLPILSQIKTVQKALLSEQKFRKARGELEIKATRNSDPASYQLYLRLLDGKAKGISSAKLGISCSVFMIYNLIID